MITEEVLSWGVIENKTQSGEKYFRVHLKTPTVNILSWYFPDGPTDEQIDNFLKLSKATNHFTKQPETITYTICPESGTKEIHEYNKSLT